MSAVESATEDVGLRRSLGRLDKRRPFYSWRATTGNIILTDMLIKTGKIRESAKEADHAVASRRLRQNAPVLCAQCACGMLLLEEAIAVAGVSSRSLHRFVEAGALHFAETPEGFLLLCLNSVLAQREADQ